MADHDARLVVDFYTHAYREDLRLGSQSRPQGRLEWARTLEIVTAALPPAPARVLDVGGGPGAYARALARRGYTLRLLDLTPRHVTLARAGYPPIDADVADARRLPHPEATFDAVLLMGPPYHLTERADRVRAVREAVRVARPGAVVAVAAISRFAGPLDFAALGRLDDGRAARVPALASDGRHDPSEGFTVAYFHRVDELVAECAAAGLDDVTVHGVEGPAWPAAEAAVGAPGGCEVFRSALRLARLLSAERDLVATSAHLLAVGRAG